MKKRSWETWPTYSPACRKDVQALLRNGTSLTALRANPQLGARPRLGSWCFKLESLAEKLTGRHAIACANATLGLTAAFKALQLPPGSVVATTAFTFSATTAAIVAAGYAPHFCDVDPETMTMVYPPTHVPCVAVAPVDLFGRPHLSMMHDLPCVQDASQAVGSLGAGREAPGDLVVWSFNGKKNVPAGEAGMVLVKDAALAERARLWLAHAENFGTDWVGTNGHLSEISARLAYHGLAAVGARNRIRQARARLLTRLLRKPPALPITTFPETADHAFYVYPLILEPTVNRDALVKTLAADGVVTQPGYITPIVSAYPAFAQYPREPLPVTEALSAQTLLLLPTQITSATTEMDIVWLAGRLRKALEANSMRFVSRIYTSGFEESPLPVPPEEPR